MMTEMYRQLEDTVGKALVVQDELVRNIAEKVEQPQEVVERVLYRTSVAVVTRPFDVAHIVNEFFSCLSDVTRPEDGKVLA